MSACFNLNFHFSDISDDDGNVPAQENRFSAPVTDSEISERIRLRMPRGTVKANCWSFADWKEWAAYRNSLAETQQDSYYPVPGDLINFSVDALD